MPRVPCEDAPCCGHGGVCGRALGMSVESYEDGFDERSDEEIKASVYEEFYDGRDGSLEQDDEDREFTRGTPWEEA